MAKPFREWTVLPHGKLRHLDENLLSVAGILKVVTPEGPRARVLIFDLANRHGLSGWLFKAIGMTGDEPHVPPVVAMRQIKDKDALRAQLEHWSHLPNLRRVIISHGDIIEKDPAQVLGRIAEDLAA